MGGRVYPAGVALEPIIQWMSESLWSPSHSQQVGVPMGRAEYRGTSLNRNYPPPLGPPQGPRYSPTRVSWGGVVFDERGTPMHTYGHAGTNIGRATGGDPVITVGVFPADVVSGLIVVPRSTKSTSS